MEETTNRLQDALKLVRKAYRPENAAELSVQMLDGILGKGKDASTYEGTKNLLKCMLLLVGKGKGIPDEKRTVETLLELLKRDDLAEYIEANMRWYPQDRKLLDRSYRTWVAHPANNAVRISLHTYLAEI